jgi:hypothetical protein
MITTGNASSTGGMAMSLIVTLPVVVPMTAL